MTIEKIYEFLNKKFPVNTAADFDNPGLLIGDKTADIKSAVLALDCTQSAIDTAIEKGAKLIITHHPVIFSGLKAIHSDDIVYTLIKEGISVISMHTNLDTCKDGVCDALANALSLEDIKAYDTADGLSFRIGILKEEMTSDDFAAFVGRQLDTAVKYVGESKVKTVGVCSGSASEYMYDAFANGCDAFVTSEIKHHQYLDAYKKGFTLVDAGHFPTEDIIIEPLYEMLSKEFPSVKFFTDHFSPVKVCINL